MAKLQLMMGGQVVQDTGLKSVGLDWRNEVLHQMEDQRFQAEEQARLHEQMQQVNAEIRRHPSNTVYMKPTWGPEDS